VYLERPSNKYQPVRNSLGISNAIISVTKCRNSENKRESWAVVRAGRVTRKFKLIGDLMERTSIPSLGLSSASSSCRDNGPSTDLDRNPAQGPFPSKITRLAGCGHWNDTIRPEIQGPDTRSSVRARCTSSVHQSSLSCMIIGRTAREQLGYWG
jgi:hypothetical protein